VINQSYKNKEILLINDGSTDNSGEICDDLSKEFDFINVIHKKNSGVSDSRNIGINVSCGDYIMFLDADDYWTNNFLEDLSLIIENNEYPDFVFSNSEYRLYSKKLNLHTHGFLHEKFNNKYGKETLKYILNVKNEYLFSIWRGIYKSSVIKREQIKFESGVSIGEDADWLFRFILKSQSSLLYETPFYVYRVGRENSAMNNKSKQGLLSFLYIVDKWINIYLESPNEVKKIICNKLSNNYVEFLKYINNYEKSFVEKITKQINKTHLFDYVSSDYGKRIKLKKQKRGLNFVLITLNIKWKIKNKLESFLFKLGIKKHVKKLLNK